VPETLRTIATLLVSFGLVACSGAGGDDTPPPTAGLEPTTAPTASESVTRPGHTIARRLVAVVGAHEKDAIELLSGLGVETEIDWRTGCATDVVVAQSPGPRQVTRSGAITLVVETGGEAGECDPRPARDQARALLAWAREEAAPPSFADDVELLIANKSFERLETPLDRRSWELCEHGDGCASALTELDAMTRPAVVAVMTGPCPDTYVLLRHDLASTLGRSATVVDKRDRSGCRDVVGVQVWVDGEGRISAVNWML
jgi:hypothetical protein